MYDKKRSRNDPQLASAFVSAAVAVLFGDEKGSDNRVGRMKKKSLFANLHKNVNLGMRTVSSNGRRLKLE